MFKTVITEAISQYLERQSQLAIQKDIDFASITNVMKNFEASLNSNVTYYGFKPNVSIVYQNECIKCCKNAIDLFIVSPLCYPTTVLLNRNYLWDSIKYIINNEIQLIETLKTIVSANIPDYITFDTGKLK